MTARQHAEILEIFEEYCAGLESFDPTAIQKVYPSINIRTLEIQFRQYKSLTCTITRAPEFDSVGCDCRRRTSRSSHRADFRNDEWRRPSNNRTTGRCDALAALGDRPLAHRDPDVQAYA